LVIPPWFDHHDFLSGAASSSEFKTPEFSMLQQHEPRAR
jgi:hypothetical protein